MNPNLADGKTATLPGPTKDELLFGGAGGEVEHEDGTREKVKVRPFKVKEYKAARRHVDDEMRLVDMACDRPAGWSETLTPETYEVVAQVMGRMNVRFFGWVRRELARQMDSLPSGALDQVITSSPSQTGSGTAAPEFPL
ncbi:MAG TPA: hypothetical protein VMF06_15930 [Candidatus Limnocylindria bacterium]|jgi:hypothetical protein|nr:hypothetical protein [Candidatus Limnocylindria bacterium]